MKTENKTPKEFIVDTEHPQYKTDKQTDEHKAWIDMFEEASKVFNLTREELNKPQYKKFFQFIERWAYHDRMLRAILNNPEEYKGCLWNGNEEAEK